MKNIFEAETNWVKAHEKILIVVFFLLAVVYLGNLWINRSSDAAIAKNAAAQQVLQQQVIVNAEITKQMAAQVQQYQQMLNTLLAQNAALASAMKQRQFEVVQQQKIDQTLPLPDLALRWEKLVNLQPTDIQATDKGLTVNEAGSRSTVQILETVPVLQADLKDMQTIGANKDKQIEGLNGLVAGKDVQVAGLRTEILDKDKACKTQITLEKAKARKSKVKWFLSGVAIGAGIVAKLLM